MKKQSILFLATVIAMLTMVSCKKNQAKDATLKNMNDSLNYSLGIVNGDAIKLYYMQDSINEDAAIDAFITTLDKAYSSGQPSDESYNLGQQIGSDFKQQKENGLMNEPDLTFNYDMVKQGLLNSLNETEGGMTMMEAQEYIQAAMQELQQEKMNALLQQQITSQDIIVEEEIK